jgi:hypothetical protein
MLLYNKKGVLAQYLLIFTILITAISIGVFYNLKDQQYTFSLGEVESEIIQSYISVSEEKYYLGNTFEVSSREVINEVLRKSGIYDYTLIDDYVLWKEGGVECFINDWEKLKNSISLFLGDEFGDYEFLVSRVQGQTYIKLDAGVNYYKNGSYYKINYSESFEDNLELDFVFDDFLSKVESVKEVTNNCLDDSSCWISEFYSLDGFTFIEKNGKLFKFEFVTPGLGEEVAVKGAINFEDYNPLSGRKPLEC